MTGNFFTDFSFHFTVLASRSHEGTSVPQGSGHSVVFLTITVVLNLLYESLDYQPEQIEMCQGRT